MFKLLWDALSWPVHFCAACYSLLYIESRSAFTTQAWAYVSAHNPSVALVVLRVQDHVVAWSTNLCMTSLQPCFFSFILSHSCLPLQAPTLLPLQCSSTLTSRWREFSHAPHLDNYTFFTSKLKCHLSHSWRANLKLPFLSHHILHGSSHKCFGGLFHVHPFCPQPY